ncbi:PTS transporter subunit EIIC [Candidatus Mycoplasma pogonae]
MNKILKSVSKIKLFNFKNKSRSFLTKLSQAFMLPIAILPFAGLLLGIGGAIGSNTSADNLVAQKVADFFKLSGIIFDNLPLLFGASIAISFTNKNHIHAVFIFLITFLIFLATQAIFINYQDGKFENILYFHTNKNNKYIIGKYLGITVLQTSIFGGILSGGLTSFIMNRWSEVELPEYLGFFSGIRLVPIIAIPFGIILGLLFLIFWPWVGLGIAYLGKAASNVPYGFDGLAYGTIARAMMPLGLHHIVIAIAFQTNLGGTLSVEKVVASAKELGVLDTPEMQIFINSFVDSAKSPITIIDGDQNIWKFINAINLNKLPINKTGASLPIFEWITQYGGAYAGKYTQDYPIYLGAVQVLGLAMILAAKKPQRKKAAAIISSSMVVAFLTGITEPLEFSFLFIAPLFYYLFYVPLSGFAYMFMKLSGTHVGVGFARGFIDYIIYGAIPIQKGTKFWVALPLSAGFGIISFLAFYFSIKKFNWETPGRGDNEIKLINKKIYQKKIQTQNSIVNNENPKNEDDDIAKLIAAYGGPENITSVTACATRLRIEVKDAEKVNSENLVELGSKGFIKKGQSTQAIFGAKAQILSGKILERYGKDIKK